MIHTNFYANLPSSQEYTSQVFHMWKIFANKINRVQTQESVFLCMVGKPSSEHCHDRSRKAWRLKIPPATQAVDHGVYSHTTQAGPKLRLGWALQRRKLLTSESAAHDPGGPLRSCPIGKTRSLWTVDQRKWTAPKHGIEGPKSPRDLMVGKNFSSLHR